MGAAWCLVMIIIIMLNTTACVVVIEMVRFLSVYSNIEDNHRILFNTLHSTPGSTRVTVVDNDFALFCLNIDIQCEVVSLYSHSIKADSDYILRVLLVSGVKRYRPNKIASDWFNFVRSCSILFHWFESRTDSKIDVRFCWIAEPNRTSMIRFSSIGFLFDFVRLDTPGILQLMSLKHVSRNKL